MEQSQIKIQNFEKRIAELEQQVEFYELVTQDSPDLEIFRSSDGKVKFVNKAFERFIGYKAEDFIEGKITEIDFVHPDDWDLVKAKIQKVIDRSPIVDFEFRMVRNDKKIIFVNLNSVPIYKNNEFMGARASIRDISEQKNFIELQKVSDKIKVSEEKFKKYVMNSPTAIFIADNEGRYTLINPAACELLNYTEEELLGLGVLDISGVEGPNKIASFNMLKEQGNTKNVEMKLRRKGGELIDVVLDAVKLSDDEFIAFVKDMTVLKETEQQLSKQVENFAALNEEYISSNEELRQINRQLTETTQIAEKNEKYLRTLIENAPFPMVISDQNQDIEFFNNKFTEKFGYTLNDVSTAEQWWAAAYPNLEYREKVSRSWMMAINRALAENTDIERQEWEIRAKDGSKRLCEFYMTPLGKSNLIIMNDITDDRENLLALVEAKQKAERSELILTEQNEEYASLNEEYLSTNEELIRTNEKLRLAKDQIAESEEQHRFLFENMTQGVVYHNIKGEVVYANDSASRILGITKEQLFGKTSLDPLWKSIREDWSAFLGDQHPAMITLKTGEPVKDSIMGVFNPKTNEYSWININSVPKYDLKNKNKIHQVIVTFEDITDLKNIQHQLVINKERYRKAQEAGKIGSWEYDIENNTFWGSDQGKIIYGFNVDTDSFTAEEVMSCVIDRKRVDRAMVDLITNDKPYDIKFEIHPKNSMKKKTLHSIGELIKDSNGKPQKVTGVVLDITKQSKQEAEILKTKEVLEESEKRFKALHNASFGGIAIHDKGLILDCNQGLSDLTGYTLDELLGMDGLLLIAESKRELVMSNIMNKYEKPYEAIGCKKDGTEYPIRLEAREIPYDGKNVRVVEFRDISEFKKVESDLKKALDQAEESEKQFRQLFENMEQSFALHEMIYDNDGKPVDYRFILLNKAFGKLIGTKTDDLIGKTVLEVLPKTEQVWIDNYGKVAKTGRPLHFEDYSQEFDKYYDVVAYSPKKDFFAVVITDVTERKNTEKILKLNADRLKILYNLNQMQDFQGNQIYDYALEKAIELCKSKIGFLGFLNEDETIVSIKSWSSSVMENCSIKNEYIDFVVEETGIWGEVVRQRKPMIINDYKQDNPLKRGTPEGHIDISNYLSIPIFDKDKIVAVIAVGNKNGNYNETDMQELILLMDGVWNIVKRLKSDQELLIAKEKAEESNRLKSAFLQNMSHEIRTPMNAIIGFSEFLSDDDLTDEDRSSYVKIIQNSCHQLLGIVTDILTISAIDTKQEKVSIQKTSINSIIVELLSIFKKQATNKNISLFAKQLLKENQSEVLTDKTKITQILSNLISNALKFTYEGFVEFGYNLKIKDRSSYLQFYVKDTGVGIKLDHHQEIFERFRQADDTVQREHGGTGLGLSICKGFVELLDGNIWVESEFGKGSTFYFTVPYNPVNKKDIPYDQANKPKKKRKNIVIAEDEEYNYLFIEISLREFDLNLIHTRNGKETVDVCKSNKNIDLVLMDIKMPVMDGHEAAKLIKGFNPKIPIIAQSAYALEQEIEQYGVVFDDYLTKPLAKEVLYKAISEYLKIN